MPDSTSSVLLAEVLAQTPVAIAMLRGPDHIITLANPGMEAIWGRPVAPLLGRPHFEALPDLAGQGFEAIFDTVYQTGKAHHLRELLVSVGRVPTSIFEGYFNIIYQPLRDGQNHITGIIASAVEVTEQVRARQQMQQLNEELELRVAARTQETQAALREAQAQREQLREQQGLLRLILGQVPAAIATLSGPEHRFSFFNDQYQALAGGRAELGQAAAQSLPEVINQGFIDLLDSVYRTGQTHIGLETPIQLATAATRQPEQRYLDFSYQRLTSSDAQPQGILAFVVDVTATVRARQQAETLQAAMLAVARRQKQEQENVYQLFEQAPAVICLLREPEHRIEYFNPAYQALFPGQKLRGRTLAQAQPEATALVALFDAIYQSGQRQVRREVAVQVPPAGELARTRYFDFTYQAYREQEHIAGVSIFGFDVTERVLARQQRDAQQAELQHIFEQAPVAIAIMRGPSLVVELANSAVAAIWGRPPAEVLGRPYFGAVPDTAGQGFEEILLDVLRTGQPFFINEAPVHLDRAHTGQPALAYVNFVFQPLFDDDQPHLATGLIAIGTEVTEQVLARQQVQTLNDELRVSNITLATTNQLLTRTNTDLDTFVYTASHDLKAPITNIEGLLTALLETLPADAQTQPVVQHILALMRDSVARFQQTLVHLTDISKLQQVNAAPAEVVDVAALVEAVRLDLAPTLQAAQAALNVRVAPGLLVQFAPKNLRSIVYNLLSNAVKYHAPDRQPQVQVRCYRQHHQVLLEVQDNGLGLSQIQQTQLFGMFRRLHTHVEGSGVGLYMVKRLVENAGGTIAVNSRLGVGSTFTVALPAPGQSITADGITD
jgi:signal transduction histidine kinase